MTNPSLSYGAQRSTGTASSEPLSVQSDSWFEPSFESAEPRIVAAIRRHFNFALLEGPTPSSMMEVVDAYETAFNHFTMVCEEGNAFLTMLCRYQITSENAGSDTEIMDSVIAKEVKKRVAALALPRVFVSEHLKGELFEFELAEAFSILRDDFAESLDKYANEFVLVLSQLLEANIIGRILWPTKNTCCFGHTNSHFAAGEEKSEVRMTSSSQTTIRSREIETHFRGQQVHLAFTRSFAMLEYAGGVPARVRNLLDEIPLWLAPAIEIVEGEVFRTGKVNRMLKSETHSVTETEMIPVPSWEDEVESSISRWKDPAVTLGPFVLAAWVPQEYELEKSESLRKMRAHRRKQKEQQWVMRIRSFRPIAWAGFGQIAPVLLHVIAATSWPSLHVFAFALAFVAIIPVLPHLRRIAVAHEVKPSVLFTTFFFVTLAVGVLAIQLGAIALIYVSAVPLIGFVLSLGACYFLVRELGQMLGL